MGLRIKILKGKYFMKYNEVLELTTNFVKETYLNKSICKF